MNKQDLDRIEALVTKHKADVAAQVRDRLTTPLIGDFAALIVRLVGKQCFGAMCDTMVDLHGKGEVVRGFADSLTWLEATRGHGVDVSHVEAFVRRMKKMKAQRGICISTESFSEAARTCLIKHNVLCYDFDDLVGMLTQTTAKYVAYKLDQKYFGGEEYFFVQKEPEDELRAGAKDPLEV
jgi:restriction endonuclease Mrr